MPGGTHGGQRIARRCQFSPSPVWVPETKLRLLRYQARQVSSLTEASYWPYISILDIH